MMPLMGARSTPPDSRRVFPSLFSGRRTGRSHGVVPVNALARDIRLAFRQMRKSPGFAIAIILCLGLGIGANIAIFDVSRAMLVPPSEISDPDRIVRIYTRWQSEEQFANYSSFSWLDYVDVRDQMDSFESAATESIQPFNLARGEEAERTWGQMVTGNYFSTLGIDMIQGRDFAPDEDDTPGTHPVLIISYGLWQGRFGGDPGIIDAEVLLNGHPFTVIGVVEEGFRGGMTGLVADMYVPMAMHGQAMPNWDPFNSRDSHWLQNVVARLKEGVTIDQAQAEIDVLMANLRESYPEENVGKSAIVVSERGSNVHPEIRPQFQAVLVMLSIVVGLLLLLTCANVAGLLLAKAMSRRKEMGVRLALGADRGRIIRQVLVESVILALIAGAVGFMLDMLIVPLTQSVQPQMDIPLEFATDFNPVIIWYTPLISLLAGLFFGIMPALEVSGGNLVSALRTGRATVEKRTHRLRGLLVGGQVALSLALLIGAGLVLRSSHAIQDIYPGFDPQGQIVAAIDLDLQGYDEEQGRTFYRDLEDRLQEHPAVSSVGFATLVPLSLSNNSTWVWPEGWESPLETQPSISHNIVTTGYFEAMGIPLVRGRGFTEADTPDSEPVMVINEEFGERFWPGEDPVNRIVRLGGEDGTPYVVIGVVPTGRYFSLGEDPQPYFYRPFARHYRGGMTIHVATDGESSVLFAPVRQIIRDLDPALPISRMQTMNDQMSFALMPSRLIAWAVTGFAVLALLLASIGLYGLIAYSVTQETREIGIRIALGAQAGQVIRHVIRRGLLLTIIGVVAGILLGVLGSLGISGVLFGISPVEPVTLLGALIVLLATALVASWLPARRATRVDPVRALEAE
ncbi:ABC transporter permease [Candidatus Zixiibacteriota bacterium]